MKAFCLGFAIVAALLVSADKQTKPVEVSAPDIGLTTIIIGRLGRPIGEAVTIQGEKVHAPKGEQVAFFVHSVNGKALKNGTTVRIDGIAAWPLGTKAEMRGQESGTVTYTDIRATSFRPNDPRFVLRQTVYLSFEASEVVAPKGLRLD